MDHPWQLKTCMFDGKKYLALAVPYADSFYGDGFSFAGWTGSSGQNMRCVAYEVNGQPINQTLISDIQDYSGAGMIEDIVTTGMRLNGPLAIGTTNLDFPLNVNGTIHSKEVKVDLTGWSDFVFKPDYKLDNLSEVKKYIETNGHLPNIPSEKEVIENGINLGDMNKKLLQKIEELTLYLIQKDEEVKEQDKKIKSIESKLEQMISKSTKH
ncbi:hypothetical protein [Pedobacter alpinus]|uniref:Uncharacterized protein n=1 Tax=Pedobacter alpinus TaxID=1590643 RepID=A0ABW5TSZ9_9SPHI